MSILRKMRTKFAKRSSSKSNQELKSWAQIEYKNDWQMVYNHMLKNECGRYCKKPLSWPVRATLYYAEPVCEA